MLLSYVSVIDSDTFSSLRTLAFPPSPHYAYTYAMSHTDRPSASLYAYWYLVSLTAY